MTSPRGAWIRYGEPVTDDEVQFAAEHYRMAILQPWETEVLDRLKDARPEMVVLAYKCLSSTRRYETGPVFTSGVDHEEAEEAGEHWFGHREDGSRIEWNTYPGHWQMATWDPAYRERWCDNVADELEGTRWDGVMADNDVYDDYYGLRPPLEGGRTMAELRAALDEFIPQVGERMQSIGKLLIPNIAESRRDEGRWRRHSAWGGGFEEVFLAWGPDDYLEPDAALDQLDQLASPGMTVVRIATDGTQTHRNVLYGLAAFWVFGGGAHGAFAATAHDAYSATPWIPQYDWDLGTPMGERRRRGNGYSRDFEAGWAAVNLNSKRRRAITYEVPDGLVDGQGDPAPREVTLDPHHGIVLRRPPA